MVGPKDILFYEPFKSLKNLSPFAIIFFCHIFTKHNLYSNRIFVTKYMWKMYHCPLCSHITNMAWSHHWQYLIRSSSVFLFIRIHATCIRKCLYQQLPKGISYSRWNRWTHLPLVQCFHSEYEGWPGILENVIAKHLDGLHDLQWKLHCLLFLFVWENHTAYNFFNQSTSVSTLSIPLLSTNFYSKEGHVNLS